MQQLSRDGCYMEPTLFTPHVLALQVACDNPAKFGLFKPMANHESIYRGRALATMMTFDQVIWRRRKRLLRMRLRPGLYGPLATRVLASL